MQQLEKLLGISSKEFYSDYQGQSHRYVQSVSIKCFDDALQLSDIENYLATVPLVHGQVQLVNHNSKPWADQFLRLDQGHIAGNVLDIQKLLGLLRDGTTAILTDMGKYIPKLGRYCEQLENELGVRIQANVYITPPNSQGFNVHIDSHDVFILQLFGQKNWRLYDGMIDYPTKKLINQQPEFSEERHKLSANIEMKSGDLLYVPQGMYHDASTQTDASVHITLGVLPKRRSEVLEMLLEDAKEKDFFRHHLPSSRDSKALKQEFIKEFKEACHKVIDEADLDSFVDKASNQFSEKRPPDLKGALFNSLVSGQLSINSMVKRKQHARFWLEEETWFTVVHLNTESVRVPKPMVKVLTTILQKEPFRVKTISSELSDKIKLDLVKKFIACGLLDIIDV